MSRHLFRTIAGIAAVLLLVVSCGKNKKSTNSLLELQEALINATADSTVSEAVANTLFLEYADSLYKRATIYGEFIEFRVDAQKRAQIAMSLAAMKFTDQVLFNQISAEYDRVLSTWVISPNPQRPELYKEIYCVTDDGVDDCIMLDVLFNDEDPTKVDGGVVWYPHNVKDGVEVVFANMKEDGSEPDFDNAVFGNITGVALAGTLATDSPLCARLDAEFYHQLQQYQYVFIGYNSVSGNPESFALNLVPLQEQIRRVGGVFNQ